MTEETLQQLIDAMALAESETFIETFKKTGESISFNDNLLLKTLFQITDEEYSVFSNLKIEELKKILYFILDHETFTLEDKDTGDENVTKSIIIAILLMTFGDERIQEFQSNTLFAPLLVVTTALTRRNDKFEQILNDMAPSQEAKDALIQNKEFLFALTSKLIQGRNIEGMGIMHKVLGNNLEIYPFDMMLVGTRYGNISLLDELLPEFEKYTEHNEQNLFDLFETAVLNKIQSPTVLEKIAKSKPVAEFLSNGFKNEENKERKERIEEFLSKTNNPLLDTYKLYA